MFDGADVLLETVVTGSHAIDALVDPFDAVQVDGLLRLQRFDALALLVRYSAQHHEDR